MSNIKEIQKRTLKESSIAIERTITEINSKKKQTYSEDDDLIEIKKQLKVENSKTDKDQFQINLLNNNKRKKEIELLNQIIKKVCTKYSVKESFIRKIANY